MASRRTKSHCLPKPDSRGRIRPCVGYAAAGKKARFQVGDKETSPAEADRRLNAIRVLYDQQCERFELACWLEWTKRVAVKIGMGQPVRDKCVGETPQHMAGVVEQLRAWGVPVDVTDEQSFLQGISLHQQQITETVQQLVTKELENQHSRRGAVAHHAALPSDPLALAEPGTVHQALDAYSEHVEATGKRNAQGNLVTSVPKCQDRLRYLKEHHPDLKLWQLDSPRLEQVAAYWRNRPVTRKGNRCSRQHASDMLKEFWRFLRWLDSHPGFHWQMPRRADAINRSPVRLPQDESGEVFRTITKLTYTPEQLAMIVRHADEFGKLLIGVCVNCAFGQGEIGQWPTTGFTLLTAHPHADRLGIQSTDADSWITGKRPKTRIYGEHLLWPQVATALQPFLDGRKVLPITSNRTPLYKTHSKNPQSKFATWWGRLIDRTQKSEPDLPQLPFGSLRDVLPDVLRRQYSDDVASLALQHGRIGEDDLLKYYANHPYKRLFEATRELEEYFAPMLDALDESRPKSPQKSPQ